MLVDEPQYFAILMQLLNFLIFPMSSNSKSKQWAAQGVQNKWGILSIRILTAALKLAPLSVTTCTHVLSQSYQFASPTNLPTY
jgi:hypothetical protein